MRMIAFRVAGCEAGRDDRLRTLWRFPCRLLACRSFVFSCRLSGRAARWRMHRFCQLVLAACRAMAASWVDASVDGMALRDGGGVIGVLFLFVSRVEG